jgi:hypothetical protein
MIPSVRRPKIFRAGSIAPGGWLKTPLSLIVEAAEETIDAGGYSIAARAVNAAVFMLPVLAIRRWKPWSRKPPGARAPASRKTPA